MKKIFSLFMFFTLIGTFIFSQGNYQAPNQQTHNSCATARLICGKMQNDIVILYSGTETCTQPIEPQYLRFEQGQNGIINLLTPGGHVGNNQAHTGNFVLYGPFNSFDLNICNEIETGQAQEQFGLLTGTNFIAVQQGHYVMKVTVNECIPTTNNLDLNRKGIILGLGNEFVCEDRPNCLDCISSFSPDPGKYIVSAWVKGEAANKNTSYENPKIIVSYTGISNDSIFIPKGIIIDDWQKVEGEFVIPPNATDIKIELNCKSGSCYFDDIRFSPVNGSMKSYVYDPVSLRLVAELDERNYATFYEYDEEGKLIRVKKETEKGIMTIQENRNNIKKR